MYRSPWLESLPVVAVEPEALSEYRLRVAVRDHQLGTAEVAIPLLERLGHREAARRLQAYFDVFRENYLAGRSNKFPANEKSDSAPSSEN